MPTLIGIHPQTNSYYSASTNKDSLILSEQQVGRTYSAVRLFYSSTPANLDLNSAGTYEQYAASTRVPVISVNYRNGDVPEYTWAQVAAGAIDSTIDSWGDQLATYAKPCYFCPNHEPTNANNYPQMGTSADFCAAFRRVAQRINARPGTGNVRFAWIMQGGKFGITNTAVWDHPDKWYPGDDVVDIVMADCYNWAPCSSWASWATPSSGASSQPGFVQGYNYARSTRPGARFPKNGAKPFGTGEVGTGEDAPQCYYDGNCTNTATYPACQAHEQTGRTPRLPNRKADWLLDMLAWVKARNAATPGSVEIILYFNAKHGTSGEPYWFVNTTQKSLDAWRTVVNDDEFTGKPPPPTPTGGYIWNTGFEAGVIAAPASVASDITKTNLISGFDDSNTTSYTTASFTLPANKLGLLRTTSSRDTLDPSAPTITGWTQVASTVLQLSGAIRRRISLFRRMSSSDVTGTVTIDFGAETQTGCEWGIAYFDGVDTGGTNGSAAIVQAVASNSADANASSFTVTLAAFGSTDNGTYGCFAVNGGGTDSLSAGSGFTKFSEQATTAPVTRAASEWRNDNDTSVDMSLGTSSLKWGGIAIELKAAIVATDGNGLADEVNGAVSVQSVIKASGTYAARLNPAAGVANFVRYVSGAPNIIGGRFKWRGDTLAVGDIVRALSASGQDARIRVNASNQFEAQLGNGTAVVGPAITTGQFYRIEFRANLSTRSLKWRIDGTAQTDATDANAASTVASVRFGPTASLTFNWYVDDLILSTENTHYPFGAGQGLALRLNITADVDGANFQDDDGTAVDSLSHLRVDDDPMTGTADYVKMIDPASIGSVSMNFADLTPGTTGINAVRAITAMHASNATGSTVTTKIARGADNVILQSSQVGGTGIRYYGAQVDALVGGAWDENAVGGLSTRFGYSPDASTTNYAAWDSFLLEVDVKQSGTGGVDHPIAGTAQMQFVGEGTLLGAHLLSGTAQMQFVGEGVLGTRHGGKRHPPSKLGRLAHSIISRESAASVLVDGFEAEEDATGGCLSASGRVAASLVARNPELFGPDALWITYHAESGKPVFGGRVRAVGSSGGLAQLAVTGWGVEAEREVGRYLFCNRAYSSWVGAEGDPHNYSVADADKFEAQVNEGNLSVRALKDQPYALGDLAGFAFWAPGTTIRQLAFVIGKSADSSNFELRVSGAVGPGGAKATITDVVLTAANPEGTEKFVTVTGNFDLLTLSLRATGVVTPTANYSVRLTHVRVWGDIGLAGNSNDDELPASEAARYIAGQLGDRLAISDVADNVLPLDLMDSTAAEASDTLCSLTDARWGRWPTIGGGVEYVFGAWNDSPLWTPHGIYEFDPVPLSRYNVVRISYLRENSRPAVVEVRADPDPLLHTSVYPITLDMPLPSNEVARQMASVIVDYLSSERWGGSASFIELRDDQGFVHSAHDARAGERIYMPDVRSVLRVQRLRRTDAGPVRVEFAGDPSAPVPVIDRLIQRRRARLSGGLA